MENLCKQTHIDSHPKPDDSREDRSLACRANLVSPVDTWSKRKSMGVVQVRSQILGKNHLRFTLEIGIGIGIGIEGRSHPRMVISIPIPIPIASSRSALLS